MEAYIRQKRAAPGMVQASDLQMRPMSGVRSTGREIHAYDGPMQFMMSPSNPDQIPSSPSNEGIASFFHTTMKNHYCSINSHLRAIKFTS